MLVKNIDRTQVQSSEAYSFPVITLSCICFFMNNTVILGKQQKVCNILCTLHGNTPVSEEICNEHAAQTMFCQSQAYTTENKP